MLEIIPQPGTPHMWRILSVDRFHEPCGHSGPQPSPKHTSAHPGRGQWAHTISGAIRARERLSQSRPRVLRHVPGLQLGVNHDDREEPQFQQLLALHGLWRDLERLPSSHRAQRIVAVRGDTVFKRCAALPSRRATTLNNTRRRAGR